MSRVLVGVSVNRKVCDARTYNLQVIVKWIPMKRYINLFYYCGNTVTWVRSLLQNPPKFYYKTQQLSYFQMRQNFITKHDSFFITHRIDFITKRGRYYKSTFYYKAGHNTFIANCLVKDSLQNKYTSKTAKTVIIKMI